MLIALVTGKGAPGATTTALALTMSWPRPALLVELDPRGSDIRLGYGQGVRTDGRGLTMLREERRANLASRLWENVVAIEGHENRWWLPGVDHPRQARLMDWPKLADLFAESAGLGVDVIADCGSIWTEKPPRAVWQAAATVGLVIRPTRPGVAAARHAAEALTADLETGGLGVERLVGVVVGGGSEVAPYPVHDVSEALPGLPLPAVIDWDRRGADILTGLSTVRRRPTRLMRQAGKAAEALLSTALPAGHTSSNTSAPAVAFAVPTQSPAPVRPGGSTNQHIINSVPGPLIGRLPNGGTLHIGEAHTADPLLMGNAGRHHTQAPPVPAAPPRAAGPADLEPLNTQRPRPAVFKHAAAIPPPPPPPPTEQPEDDQS